MEIIAAPQPFILEEISFIVHLPLNHRSHTAQDAQRIVKGAERIHLHPEAFGKHTVADVVGEARTDCPHHRVVADGAGQPGQWRYFCTKFHFPENLLIITNSR